MDRRERASGPLNLLPTCPAENTERRAFETFKGGPLDVLTVPTTVSYQLHFPRGCVQIHLLGNALNIPAVGVQRARSSPHRGSASIGPFSNWPQLCHRAGTKLGALLQLLFTEQNFLGSGSQHDF